MIASKMSHRFLVSTLGNVLLLLLLIPLNVLAQGSESTPEVSMNDVKTMEKMIANMESIEGHLDKILQVIQQQQKAVIEALTIMKIDSQRLRAVASKHEMPSKRAFITLTGYTEVPAGGLILGGKALIDATEKLLDAGIKKVEDNNRQIEESLKIQKRERKALEKRIPRK